MLVKESEKKGQKFMKSAKKKKKKKEAHDANGELKTNRN